MLRLHRKRRTRAAAYAEACVMIPVFIIIIWSYHLLYNANIARALSMQGARSEAWELAMEGCAIDEGGSCTGDGCGHAEEAQSAIPDWAQGIVGSLFGPIVTGSRSVDYESRGAPAGTVHAEMSLICNTQRETLWGVLQRVLCRVPGLGGFLSFISFC